jgi:hypothetical protein
MGALPYNYMAVATRYLTSQLSGALLRNARQTQFIQTHRFPPTINEDATACPLQQKLGRLAGRDFSQMRLHDCKLLCVLVLNGVKICLLPFAFAQVSFKNLDHTFAKGFDLRWRISALVPAFHASDFNL